MVEEKRKDDLMKGVITTKEKEKIKNMMEDENFVEFIKVLPEFELKYLAAMREIETKMKILNEDYKTRYNRSPIDNIESRLKSNESLVKKMMRNNVAFSIDAVEQNIFDIAGVRIICPFISDIYSLAEIISQNEEITIIRVKDYIKEPKESGYRSYHMIVQIPVYLTTGREDVNVEIQLRTMAMDFWSSLEHKIKYKYDGLIPDDVKIELVECADSIAKNDEAMMFLDKKVQQVNN